MVIQIKEFNNFNKKVKKIVHMSLMLIPNIFLPIIIKFIFFLCRKKKNIGKGTYIDPSVHLIRYENILIGNFSFISEGSLLNVNYRSENGHSIIIGNNCYLGRRCFISSGNLVKIKDYAMLTLDCKLLGSSHVISDPFKPYITTGITNHCSIEIGINCFLGASVIINGNVRIGYGCVIGANTFLVDQDIPPFSIVVGNPGRIIKRFNVASKKWIAVSLFTESDERNLPTEEDYLECLEKKYPRIPTPYHAIGRRFGNLP